jgi:hypothetical protein
MAYQAGASLGQFWDAMLGLRAQRLKEQEIEAELRQRQQEQIMQAASKASEQIGGAILGGMQTRKLDTLANRYLNEVPGAPRAGGVPGQAQWSDTVAASRDPRYRTGGMDELKTQLMVQRQMAGNLAQQALTDQRRLATAKTAYDLMSEPMQKGHKDLSGYTKNIDVHMDTMQKAIESGNKEIYDTARDSAVALHKSLLANYPKSGIPPPSIPPFVTPGQRKAIQDAQNDIEALRSSPAPEGSWIPETAGQIPGAYGWAARKFGLGNVDMPGQTAKEAMEARAAELKAKEDAMRQLPGAKEYLGSGAAIGNRPAPQAGRVVNGWPLGQKRVNPQTGETIIWDGKDWVRQK